MTVVSPPHWVNSALPTNNRLGWKCRPTQAVQMPQYQNGFYYNTDSCIYCFLTWTAMVKCRLMWKGSKGHFTIFYWHALKETYLRFLFTSVSYIVFKLSSKESKNISLMFPNCWKSMVSVMKSWTWISMNYVFDNSSNNGSI